MARPGWRCTRTGPGSRRPAVPNVPPPTGRAFVGRGAGGVLVRHPTAGPDRARIIGVMPVPSRTAAAALLLELDPPPWALRHARAVAEVAGWLAARIDARGTPVDRRLVETAALLHDVDKLLPPATRRGRCRTAMGRPPGSADAVTPSSPGRWPVTRSPGWPTRRATGPGPPSPAARSGSWPTPTSGPASAWNRWTPDSARGASATPRAGMRPRRQRSGPGPPVSRPMSAERPASAPTRSADWPGRARRSARQSATGGGRRMSPSARPPSAPLAYYFGDDVWSVEHAADALGRRVAGADGTPLGRWRVTGR